MIKNFGRKSLIALTLLLVVGTLVYTGVQTQAQGPKSSDLGNAILQVEKLDYYLGNEVVPDTFTVFITLFNKAGRDVPFQPEGEITFRGQSGKEVFNSQLAPGQICPL